MSGELRLDTIDIHSTELYERDGYPWREWDLLRAEAPVFWYERERIEPFWAITRHDDVHFVGSNDRLFINSAERGADVDGQHLRVHVSTTIRAAAPGIVLAAMGIPVCVTDDPVATRARMAIYLARRRSRS